MDKGLPDADVQRLTEVALGYGPNTVLWVGLADEAHPPGTVEWAGPDLLKGYIDRFAPGDDAHEFSLPAGWRSAAKRTGCGSNARISIEWRRQPPL